MEYRRGCITKPTADEEAEQVTSAGQLEVAEPSRFFGTSCEDLITYGDGQPWYVDFRFPRGPHKTCSCPAGFRDWRSQVQAKSVPEQ